MRSSSTAFRGVVAALLVLLVAACGKQDMYTGLSEVEANEITATLLSNGIKATKSVVGDKGSTVSVDPDQFMLAVKVLRDAGLPRPAKEDLGVIFKKSGITSTPFEERVRFSYGLSQEIEKTLNAIDGVIVSRVHLVLPEQPEFGKAVLPSSASVFIKYRTGTDIEFLTPQIRRLVSNAIEGLNYAAVNITTVEAQSSTALFRADPSAGASLRDDRSAMQRFLSDWRNLALAFFVLAGAGAGGFAGWRKYVAAKDEAGSRTASDDAGRS